MRRLLEFIRSIYVVVTFIILEITALGYYARSTVYTEARLLAASNRVLGGMHSTVTDMGNFFSLGSKNRALAERIAQLEEQLARYEEAETEVRLKEALDSLEASKYRMSVAAVVSNTIGNRHNYITLNRGLRSEVQYHMAVTTPEGAVVGYIIDCSERYSVAMSILNTEFRASGCIEGGNHFGAIRWDGRDLNHVWLQDLSKYAEPKVGDRVVTSGLENYFPKGMLIGTVEEAELNEVGTTYRVLVRLAADMTALSDVVLTENLDLIEINQLQKSAN